MRQVQRGISALFLVIAILAIAVAITAGYFTFYLDLKKTKQIPINSFEDCAKLYPVMESYPEQCNAPDGKHFTRELTNEEKEKLAPPETSKNFNETAKWKIYKNTKVGFEIKYPDTFEKPQIPGATAALANWF